MDTATDGYGIYAQFYDLAHGDRAPRIARVQALLSAYAPGCRSVLELACGTGSILAGLDLGKHYQLTGLDISPAMLAAARAKLPHATFVQADMANFRLGNTFDAIFCTFNSMDHLSSFGQWQAVFACASQHLAPGGLFFFDTNSLLRLQALAAHGSWTNRVADGSHVGISVRALPEDVFVWRMHHFPLPPAQGASGQAATQEVRLRIFSPSRIAHALQKHFQIVDVQTTPGDPFTHEEAGRTYYSCKKQ